MATQRKTDLVGEMSEKVQKAKVMIFADYIGIKHKQLEQLRKLLKKVEGEVFISKNTLMERAMGNLSDAAKPFLKQNTATVFSYGDEVAPLKELLKFFKETNLGKIKGGFMGTTMMSDTDVDRLSKLPGKQVLLAQLAGQLNAPVQGLHYALSWNINKLVWALSAVKEKKS